MAATFVYDQHYVTRRTSPKPREECKFPPTRTPDLIVGCVHVVNPSLTPTGSVSAWDIDKFIFAVAQPEEAAQLAENPGLLYLRSPQYDFEILFALSTCGKLDFRSFKIHALGSNGSLAGHPATISKRTTSLDLTRLFTVLTYCFEKACKPDRM
ncbi:hypothetical protein CROQUDRAFT_94779 [Cronartium quercuum f. sp. fusiforme G11]|uniref:Uncharacterized protein n=1 Tax=Cronartium quercuum f. sp. fusiforme G11 TaxID=708437 RepID=A0A9P6TA00_9BASI|nr:hypothetical protein CROQUDRAFT_94779 [Cronartium quercuum f. sp. fusiforme G11]